MPNTDKNSIKMSSVGIINITILIKLNINNAL